MHHFTVNHVDVTDASEAAVMEFLQFFYLNKVELMMENIAGVMYLGHKYNVLTCFSACVQFLKYNLYENIFIALKLAILYDQRERMKIRDGFLECDKGSEVEIFEACMNWDRAKSKQTTQSQKRWFNR